MSYKVNDIIKASINDEYDTVVKGKIIDIDTTDGHLIYVLDIIDSEGNIEIHQSKNYKNENKVAVNDFEVIKEVK